MRTDEVMEEGTSFGRLRGLLLQSKEACKIAGRAQATVAQGVYKARHFKTPATRCGDLVSQAGCLFASSGKDVKRGAHSVLRTGWNWISAIVS